MDFEQARFNMIEQQIRPWNVLDPQVLDLLFTVKREDFVPAAYRSVAFADLEIPLAGGASMLAPKMEAKALQELALKPTDKVLEIGTGSGYMAALLAAQAERVVSVEISPALAATARENLARAGIANVQVEVADGALGLPAHGPFDAIMVSGAVPVLPQQLLAQLKVGGRLFAIVGKEPVMEAQLVLCTAPGTFTVVNLFETVAAPIANAPQPNQFAF